MTAKNNATSKGSSVLFWYFLKMLTFRFGVLALGFLILSFFLDGISNVSKVSDANQMLRFLYFTLSKSIKIITETMPLITLISFVWLFISLNNTGQIKSSMGFGVSPFVFLRFGISFCLICSLFYLFALQSSFVKLLNYAETDFTDAVYYTTIKQKQKNHISLVKENKDGVAILYLTNASYDLQSKSQIVKINADQLDMINYNIKALGKLENWSSFKNVLIKQNKAIGGIEIIAKDSLESFYVNIDFNFLINKIDSQNKDLFAFSFLSLPFKIFKLRAQKLSYNVFEYQFYAKLANAMMFCLSMLIPMLFLFNLPKRSISVISKIIASVFSFFICFIIYYTFSSYSANLTNGYYILLFNLLPVFLMITFFLYLNIRKYS